MSRLNPVLQKVLGGTLTPANNIAQFASTVTGTPVYTGDPDTIQALAAFSAGGIQASLIQTGGGLNSPVFQELTGLFYLLTYQMKALIQGGMATWLATETYYIGQMTSDGAGQIYVSKTNGNLNHAVTDAANWTPLGSVLKAPPIAKATVCFGPFGAGVGNVTIFSSFNVTNVYRNSVGNYTVNFTTDLGTSTYAFNASPQAGHANTYASGNDGIVTNSVFGSTSYKTGTQLTLYCLTAPGGTLVDPSAISLTVFGP